MFEIEKLKNELKQKQEIENLLNVKNQELYDEIGIYLESLANAEKKLAEESNKCSDLEKKYQIDLVAFTNKETFLQNQIDNLKSENEKVNKMLKEKISDEEILTQKEKILNQTKVLLEGRIQELTTENEKLRNELLANISKLTSEKSDLLLQLENQTRELNIKTSEFDLKKEEIEILKKKQENELNLEKKISEEAKTRSEALLKKNKEIEIYNLALIENENKLYKNIQNIEKDIKEKSSITLSEKAKIEELEKINRNAEKEIKDLKENINELKNGLKTEIEIEKK
jgi:hypothetical protein